MVIRSFCCRGFIAVAILVNVHCGSDRVPQRPDILLITIDTLRADSLEPYGATDTLTPNIAALADRGVVYEAATTPMPLTRPAHASILTGLYPDQLGVLTNHQVLPENHVTLAEILSDTGYQTAGFTGIRFLNRRSGLAQGFEDFAAPNDKTENPRAKSVVERAIDWLRVVGPEDPVLLWVHVYDPHQPYDPPRKFRRGIDRELEKRIPAIRWKVLNRVAKSNNGDVPSDVYDLALGYYRCEVEYTDFWIGRLLENFDRLRDSRESMVVLTSDHGECFENGNYFEHADCLYEGALQVPLIIRYPNGVGAGLRVDRRVSNLDITPTILHELSRPLPEDVAGLPLQEDFSTGDRPFVLVRAPEIRNPDRVPARLRIIRSVVGEPVAPATDPRTRGVVDQLWKYLWTPESEQLFRLPDERLNRASEETDLSNRLLDALEAEMLRYPAGGIAPEDQDPETLEALEALGYVQ
jgi:arylsulfatase A-like enzyme